jgi:signal transduction histidine kinase
VRECTEELQGALAIREQFLSAGSHELKTPLMATQLYIDSLVEAVEAGRLSEEERRQRLERASASCRRLGRLIENLPTCRGPVPPCPRSSGRRWIWQRWRARWSNVSLSRRGSPAASSPFAPIVRLSAAGTR